MHPSQGFILTGYSPDNITPQQIMWASVYTCKPINSVIDRHPELQVHDGSMCYIVCWVFVCYEVILFAFVPVYVSVYGANCTHACCSCLRLARGLVRSACVSAPSVKHPQHILHILRGVKGVHGGRAFLAPSSTSGSWAAWRVDRMILSP